MKKHHLNGKLSIHKTNIARLDAQQMEAIVAGGPKRSIRLNGDCIYSRNHYTQCTSADKYSRTSICVECPNS